MIILDPEREGCHVWVGDHVTYIRGNPSIVCETLYHRLGYVETVHTLKYGTQKRYKQICYVGLDIVGIGEFYYDALTNMGINVEKITGSHIDKILPILLDRERYESNE